MLRKILATFFIHVTIWFTLIFIFIANFFAFTPVQRHYHCERRYVTADFTYDVQNFIWNGCFWSILVLCFALQVTNIVMGGLIYFHEKNTTNSTNEQSNLRTTDMVIYDSPYDRQYLQPSV